MALPLWREALVGMDWLSLRASSVYRGIGVPHGDGSVVVLIPGFLGSGHSLGGTLARSVAVRKPQLVASVITMASPFRAVRAHPMVLGAAMIVRRRILSEGSVQPDCYSGFCSCDFLNSLRQPLAKSIVEAAIYTKGDGVIDWRCCINDDPKTDIEVQGTHVGLVFNSQVYRHVANVLATAVERNQHVPDSQTA